MKKITSGGKIMELWATIVFKLIYTWNSACGTYKLITEQEVASDDSLDAQKTHVIDT